MDQSTENIFYKPQEIPEDRRQSLLRDFNIFVYKPGNDLKLFNELDPYFFTDGFQAQFANKYFDTYWRFYVEATWSAIRQLDKDIFERIIPYQLSTAYMLGLAVEDKIFNYLILKNITFEELRKYYQELRQNFQKVNYSTNLGMEMSPTIKEVVEKYTKRSLMDDIESAEFYSSIEEYLFPPGKELYLLDDGAQREATLSFLNLLEFFYKDYDIEAAVRSYQEDLFERTSIKQIDPQVVFAGTTFAEITKDPREGGLPLAEDALDFTPQELRKTADELVRLAGGEPLSEQRQRGEDIKEEESTAEEALVVSKPKKEVPKTKPELVVPKLSQPEKEKISSKPKKKSKPKKSPEQVPPVVEKKTDKKMSPAEVKQMIESRFKKDKSGQFNNIEGVLALLGQLADTYKDPSIAELYYFDENAGGFKWNEELIK